MKNTFNIKGGKAEKLVPVILIWLIVIVVWGAYRQFFRLPEWVEEIFFKPLIFVGPVIWYMARFEKLTPPALGLRTQNAQKILLWGAGFGLFLVAENFGIWLLKGRGINLSLLTGNTILISTIISLATAISEEILYRGFLLERMWQRLDREHLANGITAVLFMLGHVGNGVLTLGYRGQELATYLLLILVVGFAQGFVYGRTRSVYASGITHTLWNFSNSFFR